MENKNPEYILDQRKWGLHVVIAVFALLVVTGYSVFKSGEANFEDMLSLFILLVIQLELFMTVAIRLFRDVKPGGDRRLITRTLLSRFALFLVICFIIALIILFCSLITASLIHGLDPVEEIRKYIPSKFSGWLKGTAGGLLFGAAIFIYVQWQDALKREQKLREQNLIFQNETLKTQINPHFLFNNLNTLSSLIISNPVDAEIFTSKLASIYRYIIENSNKDRVSLKAELEFITEYFYLYRIRDEEKIRLDIEIGNTDNLSIIPVSLQVLVENAIKHNKATRDEPLNIKVTREGDTIVVANKLQRMASRIRSTGIGLKNLSERVRLLTGKEVVVEETTDMFIVKVPLIL